MSDSPACPHCQSTYTYASKQNYFACSECGQEFSAQEHTSNDLITVKDANGTSLHDGDSVTLIKDLKVKGSSIVIKVGTKVNNIRLIEGDHDIDCKIKCVGAMQLKSEFVKKVS